MVILSSLHASIHPAERLLLLRDLTGFLQVHIQCQYAGGLMGGTQACTAAHLMPPCALRWCTCCPETAGDLGVCSEDTSCSDAAVRAARVRRCGSTGRSGEVLAAWLLKDFTAIRKICRQGGHLLRRQSASSHGCTQSPAWALAADKHV